MVTVPGEKNIIYPTIKYYQIFFLLSEFILFLLLLFSPQKNQKPNRGWPPREKPDDDDDEGTYRGTGWPDGGKEDDGGRILTAPLLSLPPMVRTWSNFYYLKKEIIKGKKKIMVLV